MNGIVLGQSTKMAEALAGFCDKVYLVIDKSAYCSRNFKEINDYPQIESSTSMFSVKGIIPRTVELVKWIKRYEIDIIFSQTKYDMIAAKLASFFVRKKIKLLGTSHNSYAWLDDSAVKKMSTLIRMTNDCYVALASFVYEKLKAHGLNEEQLLLLPNTIEYNEWVVKQDYSLKDKIRMVYVAYVRPEKRQLFLVDVIERLSKDYDIKVDCFGDLKRQDYVDEISISSIEKGVAERINLKGAIENSELRSMLANYDLYICPTQMEMSPVNILEAKAAGLPVISSIVGGIPDMITDGVDGLLFEVDNADDACSKIRMLLGDSNLREYVGKNGRLQVSSVYTSRESSKRLEEIVNKIASKK